MRRSPVRWVRSRIWKCKVLVNWKYQSLINLDWLDLRRLGPEWNRIYRRRSVGYSGQVSRYCISYVYFYCEGVKFISLVLIIWYLDFNPDIPCVCSVVEFSYHPVNYIYVVLQMNIWSSHCVKLYPFNTCAVCTITLLYMIYELDFIILAYDNNINDMPRWTGVESVGLSVSEMSQ